MLPVVLNKRKRIPADVLEDAVYVGRPTKWGNPFSIGSNCTRAQAIDKFVLYLRKHPELKEAAKRELRGRDLVCWCVPLPCHASIWLRIANEDDI